MSVPLEHDYIGLSSDPSSSSTEKSDTTNNNNVLGLKATELRLGLPGLCQDFEENICKNGPVKNNVSGAKRGFSHVIFESTKKTEELISTIGEEKNKNTKAQVVGWPPIRSFRKNTMATPSSKTVDIAEGNSGCGGCLYVKVSMDGAPYLRKFDLKACQNYTQLSKALEKMFNCFILGQCTSKDIRGKEGLSESNVKDLLRRDECVLTYEDKDGDWMLVGDVPWEMFVDSCKRIRIMKGFEAIGLDPRSMEKSKNQTRGI